MPTFDDYIEGVCRYIELLQEQDRPAKSFCFPSDPEQLREGLPVQIGVKANQGIILRGDTFLELGNPEMGSASHLLWTTNPSLLSDGKMTLIGPDIPESEGGSLPFGQVLLLAGPELTPADHERLKGAQHVGDHIDGYMVRSTSDHIWSRVSKEAGAKGFDFATLGRALMNLVKSKVSTVSAMEVIFITSSKKDVKGLDLIVSETQSIGREMIKETWKERGFDIDCEVDCASCHDQEVCDDIRDIIHDTSSDEESDELRVVDNPLAQVNAESAR
jgi:CO dehydrogenase/acetyl-CoA synthase beta subunit